MTEDSVRTVDRGSASFNHDVVNLPDARHKHVGHVADNNLFPSRGCRVKRGLLTGCEQTGEADIDVE